MEQSGLSPPPPDRRARPEAVRGRQGYATMAVLLPDRPMERNHADNRAMLAEETADTDGVVPVAGAPAFMDAIAALPHAPPAAPAPAPVTRVRAVRARHLHQRPRPSPASVPSVPVTCTSARARHPRPCRPCPSPAPAPAPVTRASARYPHPHPRPHPAYRLPSARRSPPARAAPCRMPPAKAPAKALSGNGGPRVPPERPVSVEPVAVSDPGCPQIPPGVFDNAGGGLLRSKANTQGGISRRLRVNEAITVSSGLGRVRGPRCRAKAGARIAPQSARPRRPRFRVGRFATP